MGRLGFVSTAGAVALLLGAAGCADDPEPRFAPPSGESSPSASPTESPSRSAAPNRLDREETVRAWVEARNAALQDGDTTGVRSFYADPCEGCAAFVDPIDDAYRAGGYFDTPGWEVQKTLVVQRDLIDTRVAAAAGSSQGSAEEDPVRFSSEVRDLRFELRQVSGKWLIASIGVLER